MLKTMPNAGEGRQSRLVASRKHPVSLTALLYLKDALKKERYELCPDLIAVAKEFGASGSEVAYLLEDPRRSPI